jgi:hypothetical protein
MTLFDVSRVDRRLHSSSFVNACIVLTQPQPPARGEDRVTATASHMSIF